MMRIWLHTSTKSAALGPSGAVSVLAHAALLGGAIYGTGRASRALEESVAERIYYLPPPDRAPGDRPVAQRVRYVAPGAGDMREAASPTGRGAAGARGRAATHEDEHPGTDATDQPVRLAGGTGDSVYSILNVDETAARVEGSAAPVYPAALIEQHVEGVVQARYVIDTTGHTDSTSIEILASSHPGFTQSVRDAIPRMRFTPGKVGGRPVRQVVEQNFVFHLLAPAPSVADNTRAIPPA